MRTVPCKPLGRSVSVLGFGCASLGSRVSDADGQRALGLALDHGVTWFDTAPPYGDGRAERLLGSFLGGRRHEVVICTKAGIARPSGGGGAKALIRAALQPVVKAMPALRPMVARMRPPPARPPLTASFVTASLEGSLRELGTDFVDVLALHEPSGADVANHELLMALEAAVSSGKARSLSIAGDADVCVTGLTHSASFQMGQFPLSPTGGETERVRTAAPDAFLLTHGVLGSGAFDRYQKTLCDSPDATARLADLGYAGPGAAAEVLLDRAFAANDGGVVLMSMFKPDNILRNTRQASRPVGPKAGQALADTFHAQGDQPR